MMTNKMQLFLTYLFIHSFSALLLSPTGSTPHLALLPVTTLSRSGRCAQHFGWWVEPASSIFKISSMFL
jgi:hypothetical protein